VAQNRPQYDSISAAMQQEIAAEENDPDLFNSLLSVFFQNNGQITQTSAGSRGTSSNLWRVVGFPMNQEGR
jgi:hypothetical protein